LRDFAGWRIEALPDFQRGVSSGVTCGAVTRAPLPDGKRICASVTDLPFSQTAVSPLLRVTTPLSFAVRGLDCVAAACVKK